MNLAIENRIVDEMFANSEAIENLLVLADDIGPASSVLLTKLEPEITW